MKLSWKLLPLAAVVALGVAVLLPGGVTMPTRVSADVDTFELPDTMSSGDEIEGTATFDPGASGNVTIEVTDPGDATDIVLDLTDCSVSCSDDDGSDDVIVVSENVDDLTFSLTAVCDTETAITVRTSEEGADSSNETVNCAPAGNITISKELVDGTDRDFDFTISGDSSCDEGFTLSDGESTDFDCDTPDTYTITEEVPAGWILDDIQCSDENISSADIEIDVENGSVEVNLDDVDQALNCTFINDFTGTVTPGTAGSVTLTVSTNSPPCNLPVVVIATVRDANQQLLSGVTVEFSAPKGTFTISSGQTAAGVLSTLYTGPSTGSESIVLTATAGGKTGTTTITTNCAEASPTATATTVVPTATTGGGIQPPNTGDAGLKSDGGSNTYVALGALLAVISTAFVGTAVVARRGS